MTERLLYTDQISKVYKGRQVLNSIDMTINKGDIYGFIGKNGAGKTTFIRIVTNLIAPSSGKINYTSPNIKMSAVIESPALYHDMTAKNNLIYCSKLSNCIKSSKTDEILELIGLQNTEKKLVRDFSLGMKQRLGIGIAIVNDPEFLILDEPINGLDPIGIVEIRNIIKKINKELGTTILISSHILSELELIASRYGIINDGTLIKELSKEELDEEIACYAFLETSDNQKAIKIIREKIIKEVTVKGELLTFIASKEICKEISEKLLKEEVAIYQFRCERTDLEDFFLNLIEE